jgi:hypothetical protein
LKHSFPLDVLMVPTSVLAFSTNGEHLTSNGFSLGETIHLGSFEFIADYFGGLILSPRRSDTGTTFMDSTRSEPQSLWQPMTEDSTDEFHMTSSGGGGSACSCHNPIMAGERSGHSIYDDGSTTGAGIIAAHQPLLRAMSHSLGGVMSMCPCLATQCRARDSVVMEQARYQADDGHGPGA